LPSVTVELMKLTRQAHVQLGAVRQLLERDSLLAAGVLQLAQSALYSRRAPILADQKGSGARRLAPPAFEEIAFALQTVHGEASAVLADAWNLHPEVR